MSKMRIKFDDECLGLFLLLYLPESLEAFWVSMTSFSLRDVVSLETAKGGILNKDMRSKSHGYSSQFEELATENKGRSHKTEPKGGREKHISKSNPRYKNLKFHYCHKIGHIQKYYY